MTARVVPSEWWALVRSASGDVVKIRKTKAELLRAAKCELASKVETEAQLNRLGYSIQRVLVMGVEEEKP